MAAESGSADVYTSELNSALDWIRTTWVLASTFLVAVVRVRKAIGPSKVLSVKLNTKDFVKGGFSEEECEAALAALAETGAVDIVELSGGTYEFMASVSDAEMASSSPSAIAGPTSAPSSSISRASQSTGGSPLGAIREGFFTSFAARMQRKPQQGQQAGPTVMLTGGFRSPEGATSVLQEGLCHVVGLCRPLCIDPALPSRWLAQAAPPPTAAAPDGARGTGGAPSAAAPEKPCRPPAALLEGLGFARAMVTKEMAKHMPTVHECPDVMMPLRDFVTANDETRFDGMAQGNLRLDVTHSNLVQRWHDILFHDDMTIMQVKEKLYRHGGTSVAFQELYLRRGGDTIFLMDESKSLRYYGAKNGMEIHIKDLDPHSISKHGGLEDVSQVEKYVMPDEEYDKMKNTVRAVRREREAKAKAEREAREAAGEELGEAGAAELGGDARTAAQELTTEELAAAYPLGSRCECDPGARRGAVRYTGSVTGAKGLWIGVCLDEPQGQNDGSKNGVSYFDCPGPSYGCFLKPENVRVGDYPERDPFASDDDEF